MATIVRVPLALVAGALLIGACKKAAPPVPPPAEPAPAAVALRVTGIEVGKSIMADKMIANATNDFGPRDTIYVSVATEGVATSATIAARFTFETGQLVDESTQNIAPSGPAHTEFHISKPSGWPAGKYKVEITLNSVSAGTKEFEVKKG